MKISIIHATRRGAEAWSAINMWLCNASHTHKIEYILSVDKDDKYNYDFSDVLDFNNFILARHENKSAVEAFNKGAEIATGDLFVCISDDMACFLDWDIALVNDIGNAKDFYLKVQDGIQKILVTLPIFDREYYNRLGYVWNPLFRHMFSDQEATAVAIMLGRYIQSNLMFPHNHYTVGGMQKDAINAKNDSTWSQGQNLFNERLKSNFGVENPVVKYEEIVWR